MRIISKKGKKEPPPTADGMWPFGESYYRQDEDLIDEEKDLSGQDEEVLRKTLPIYDWAEDFLD
jgi:hypothetical protein